MPVQVQSATGLPEGYSVVDVPVGEDPQKYVPEGWHLASEDELKQSKLADYAKINALTSTISGEGAVSDVLRRLHRSALRTGESVLRAGEAGANLLGIDSVEKALQSRADTLKAAAEQTPVLTGPQDFSLEEFKKNPLSYAGAGVVEVLPTTLTAMAPGLGAGRVAGALAQAAGKAPAVVRGAQLAGLGVGSWLGNSLQEAGSIYSEVQERTGKKVPGASLVAGAAAGALERSKVVP